MSFRSSSPSDGRIGSPDSAAAPPPKPKPERVPGIASVRGWSLHAPASAGNMEAVRRLLDQGAFVDELDEDGWTPLRWAVQYGQCEVVQALVDAGADVEARTGGKTALHRAAYMGRQDVCEVLLKAGADPNPVDDDGFVPFDIVYCPKDHRDYTREVLQEYGAKKKKNPEARVIIRDANKKAKGRRGSQ
mmetsp:Transcript_1582/g.3792  ORF Transcript_1582/g.3792 Transcript_1582/m.3792 type:complete len:189 (-) Transcript_1582:133-699(-)